MELVQAPGRPRQASLEQLYVQSNLTRRQLLMWIGQTVLPSSPEYNMASLYVIDGTLDSQAFTRAAQALVASCDNLRTRVAEHEGVPRQDVAERLDFTIQEIDLRDHDDPMAQLDERVALLARHPFTLERCLFRFVLFRLPEGRSAWFSCLHHMIGDGWTVRLLFERMSELYRQALVGEGPLLQPALPSFAEYVTSQRDRARTAEYAADAAWWEEHLAGSQPVLLYGRTVPAGSGAARRVHLQLGTERTRRLQQAADTIGTLYGRHQAIQSILQATLHAWLHRAGPNAAPTIAWTSHNRLPTQRGTAGLLMEMLPVRVTIARDETFRSLIERVTATTFEALEHRGCAVANTMHRPAWEVVLNYLPTRFGAFAGMRLVRHEWVHSGHASRALTVNVHDFEDSGDLRVDFDLREEAFEASHAASLPGHFLRLLDALLDNLDQRLDAVDMLTESEKAAILSRVAPPPRVETTYVGMFERAARRHATHTAVRSDEGGWTFGDLDAQANRLARRLQALGVGPGRLAAVHLRAGPLVPLAVLAVLKAGAGYVPLDAGYPAERLAFMLDDAEVSVVLTEEALLGRLGLGRRTTLVIDAADEARERASLPAAELPLQAGLHDIAYVIYTSGSTGRPKGVRIHHHALATFIEAIRDAWLDQGDVVVFTTPLSFDLHLCDLLLPLVVGATLVPVARDVAADGTRLAAALRASEASAMIATPSTFRMLIDAGWEGSARMKVLCGGEVMSPELARDLLDRVASLQNIYGPTEATCYVTAHRVTGAASPVPIGRPLPGVRAYILDEHGMPLPDGMPGELVIGGPQVGSGYLGRPELTASRFVPDPWSADRDARMYRTGDLARWRPDGALDFLGRLDHQVKIRGHRIELGEIEHAVSQHESVRQTLVCAREDLPGEPRLVAYLVGEVDVSALRAFLRQRLPEYMVPSAFVRLDAFPLTPNGKIDRKQLPAPARVRDTAGDAEGPRDLLHFQLAKLFEDILGVQPVGMHESFFELGGNSLLGVRLLSRIEQVVGRRLPSLQTLFDAPTPHGLATVLSQDGWQPSLGSVVPLQPRGDGAPFFCVHAFIGDVCRDLARHCGTAHPFYGLQPRGLDGREPPLRTIAEMAAFYIEEIQRVQPRGPYHLGGYSFGGLVAAEMATLLKERGEEVALLAIIDAEPRNLRPSSWRERVRKWVNAPLIALDRLLALLRHEPPTRLLAALRRKVRTHRLKRLDAPSADDGMSLVEQMYGMSRWPGNYQRIARINLLALLRHIPRRYEGPLTLIRRRGRLHRLALEAPDWSWSDLGAAVDVRYVDGGHDELMVEPAVRQVGRIIEEQLKRSRWHATEQPEV